MVVLTVELLPPLVESPQVTTPNLLFRAIKLPSLEYTSLTPEEILLFTDELSPPVLLGPQETTLPSLFKAAKALAVE